jgi:hypothetical protein
VARQSRVSQVMFAQELHTESLLTLPNVIRTGTGYRQSNGEYTNEVCVQIFVERKYPLEQLPPGTIVPTEVTAEEARPIRTDVIETGPLDAFQDTTRYRPVPGGCSIGPQQSNSAGTLGGWAADNTDDTIVLLTNNHVISNLDTQPTLRGVCQPGRLDGGTFPADQIGTLKRDVTLTTVPSTSPTLPAVTAVDAAIGTMTVDRTDNVLNVGPAIYELQAPTLGMNVQKRGRTSQLTTNGTITSINGTFTISYRNRTRLGRIANSFVITSTDGNQFSAAGDSGSLITNQQRGQLNNTLPNRGPSLRRRHQQHERPDHDRERHQRRAGGPEPHDRVRCCGQSADRGHIRSLRESDSGAAEGHGAARRRSYADCAAACWPRQPWERTSSLSWKRTRPTSPVP